MDRIIEKKTWTPKKLALIGGGALLLVFLIYTLLFADHSTKLNVDKERLSIGTVKTGQFQEFIAIEGSVEPERTVFLDIIEGGRVEKLYKDDGDMVKRGDTLIKLSNATLQVDFMNRESQLFELINQRSNSEVTMKQDRLKTMNSLADIEYQLALSKRKHERNEELFKEGAISHEEYEQGKDEYNYNRRRKQLGIRSLKQDSLLMFDRLKQLDESIRRMRTNISVSRGTLDNLYVVAPMNGQLSTLKAEVGESKTPGENIGQIDAADGFKVTANIDQHYLPRVHTGLKGQFDFGGKTYELTITKVIPEVTNGQFKADMQLAKDAGADIKRGQTLQIRLHLNDGDQALLLPRGGFYQSTGGAWAFVVNKSGKSAEKRSLKLGRQNPQYYEVLEGLKPGDQVVINSYDGYGDSEKLELE